MTPQEMKEANVAIKGAVADFVGEIAGMFGEWEEVDPRVPHRDGAHALKRPTLPANTGA
jgi:hypothetical protein